MTAAQTVTTLNELYSRWIDAADRTAWLRRNMEALGRQRSLAIELPKHYRVLKTEREQLWKTYNLIQSTTGLWPSEDILKGAPPA